MAKSKCPECVEGSPAWMATFSDLMSLLLCFFVLIVSMSKIVERDFWVAAGSLRGAFGVMTANPAIISLENTPLPTMKNIQRAIIDKSVSNMQDFIESKNLGESVKVVVQDKGVALSISAPVLFQNSEAEMEPSVYPLLEEVFKIAQGWPNVIRVEGHTDDTRIAGGEFETNWDLSFARALSVVQFAIDYSKIHPSRLAPVAYGQHRPIADNATAEGKAKNRRIELFMEYKKETEDPFK
jgi:chemotaxis protein MotB